MTFDIAPVSKFIARTGRVQSWIDSPEGRLGVSCTVYVVEDSMEGPDSIEDSWRFASYALRNAAGVSIHLSKLRPKGSDNGRGLTASGPVSFSKFYSCMNEVLRRGGTFRNGAITLHLDYTHPDALEFINASRASLPWVKRCLDVDADFLDRSSPDLIRAVLAAIAKGDLWLNKIKHDPAGNRIYGNVCLEVYLPHRGTCLLQHVNLGQCRPGDLLKAFTEGMESLLDLHPTTGVGDAGVYLDPSFDKQVGLGVLGLANYLANNEITYHELAEAFRWLKAGPLVPEHARKSPALDFIFELQEALHYASLMARETGMARAFAIAPTATCAYHHKDLEGWTTTPELAPPVDRVVERDSGTFGVEVFEYPPNVEIAEEVGWKDYKTVVDGIVGLFGKTGLFHGYSFNSWSDVVTYDRAFLEEWLRSPQTSLYYSLQVKAGTQAKDDATMGIDASWFDFEGIPDDEEEVVGGFCSSENGGCAE